MSIDKTQDPQLPDWFDKPYKHPHFIDSACDDAEAVIGWKCTYIDLLKKLVKELAARPSPASPAPQGAETCPRCNGQGHTWIPPHVPGDQAVWAGSDMKSHPCPPCNGTGILRPAPAPVAPLDLHAWAKRAGYIPGPKGLRESGELAPVASPRKRIRVSVEGDHHAEIMTEGDQPDWLTKEALEGLFLAALRRQAAAPVPRRFRVEIKEGFNQARRRGVLFYNPKPGDQWANVLLDGADAVEQWQWRTLQILGPDTRATDEANVRRCGAIRNGRTCWTEMTMTGWKCPACAAVPPQAKDGPEALARAAKMVALMDIMTDPWFTPEFKLNRIAERFGAGPSLAAQSYTTRTEGACEHGTDWGMDCHECGQSDAARRGEG